MQSVQAEPANRLLSVTAVVIGEVRTVHQGRVTDKHVAGRMILSHHLQGDEEEEGANEYVFIGPALVPTYEWGQRAPDWVDFNATFGSSEKYIKEVNRFLCFHEARENCREEDLLESVKAYFTENMDPDKTAEEDRRAPTTMKGVMSMLMKFWLYTQRGDLKRLAPLIVDKLKTWSKNYKITKAPTFSKKDMSKYIVQSYYQLHTNPCLLYTLSLTVNAHALPQTSSTLF
jgi:hypothetical protein